MIAALMGWIGTLGSIGAYFMLMQGRWQAASLRYSVLNGLAGLLAGTASALYGAWPSAASNFLWAGIATHSVVGIVRARRRPRLAVVTGLPFRDPDPEPVATEPALLARAA